MKISLGVVSILIVFVAILIVFANEIKDNRKSKLLEKYGYKKEWRGGNKLLYKNPKIEDVIFMDTIEILSASELKARLKRAANVQGNY